MKTQKQIDYIKVQKSARLNRLIAHFETRVKTIGEATTPQQKRALTLASKCLRRSVRELKAL